MYSLVVSVASLAEDHESGWFGILEHNDSPILALAQTPHWPFMMAAPGPFIEQAGNVLVRAWKAEGLHPPGINGPKSWVEGITVAMGASVRDRMGLRLFLLEGQPKCPHPAPGKGRKPMDDDTELLRDWELAFQQEVEADGKPKKPSSEEVRKRFNSTLIWDDSGARSMARAGRPLLGGWTISGVYTPPPWRGKGYAGSAVHGLCENLLADGAEYLALYTDIANPTSNHIYQEIGFVPVCDQFRVFFNTESDREG